MKTMILWVAVAGLGLISESAMAVPYASKIAWHHTTMEADSVTTLSYFLNEPADGVAIEIVDEATSTVAATFPGPTARGKNTLAWNGRADNGEGAVVPVGNYRATVSAHKNHAQWTEIASHRSQKNAGPTAIYNDLFTTFSPMDVLPVSTPDSPYFGSILALQAGETAPKCYGVIELNSDLSVAAEDDGYASRIFRETNLDTDPKGYFSHMRRTCMDPEDDHIFYVAGETAPYFWYGDMADPAELHSAAGSDSYLTAGATEALVVKEENQKYVYFISNKKLYKAPMTGRQLAGAPQLINADMPAPRFLGLAVDKFSNFYAVASQYSNATHSGRLYRFPPSAVAGPSPEVLEHNNHWLKSFALPKDKYYMGGPAVCPVTGDVFVFAANTDGSSAAGGGIYLAGHISNSGYDNAAITTADHRVIRTENWHVDYGEASLRMDHAGNAILSDQRSAQIRVYSPAGYRETKTPAPASQRLTVIPRAAVANWDLY